MAFFSHDDRTHDFNRQIAALQKQITALSRSASKHGTSAYRDASEEASHLYDEMSSRVADALPVIRKRARNLEEAVRDNPTRAVATVGLAALVVTAVMMLVGRRH